MGKNTVGMTNYPAFKVWTGENSLFYLYMVHRGKCNVFWFL